MKNKSVFIKFCLVLSMLVVNFFLPVQVTANGETVDIVVHKHLRERAPAQEIKNTGQEMNVDGDPLQGAGFTAYDVTKAYHTLVKEGRSQAEAIKEISTNESRYKVNVIRVEQKTNSSGQTTFKKLPLKDNEGKDKVYMFIETSTPEGVTITEKATPIVLAMPVYKLQTNGQFSNDKLSTVHVYPKNIGFVPEEPSEPDQPSEPEKPKEPNEPGEPEKPSKPVNPLLPKTGEAETMLGLFGVLLIVLSIILWKKRSIFEK